MKKPDQLYTLNLTVVALVALVAIVGVTAIVLNGDHAASVAEPLTADDLVLDEEGNVVGMAGTHCSSSKVRGTNPHTGDAEWGTWCWAGNRMVWVS